MSLYPILAGSAFLPFQAAIFKRLKFDDVLRTMVNEKVYDTRVPQSVSNGKGVPMPYIVVGGVTETPSDRLTTEGKRVSLMVQVHSDYQGMAEAGRIADRVQRLLSRQENALPVEGWLLNQITMESMQGLGGDGPDDSMQLMMRFVGLLQPIPGF